MNIFLKLKHWQLFCLILIMSFTSFLFFMQYVDTPNRNYLIGFILAFIAYIFIILGWVYFITIFFLKKIKHLKIVGNKIPFRIAMFILILIVILFVINILLNITHNGDINKINFPYLIMPLCLLFSVCLLYCFYCFAKILKTVELKRQVYLNEFIGEIFLLCFLYIGLWVLQPRINKLFSEQR